MVDGQHRGRQAGRPASGIGASAVAVAAARTSLQWLGFWTAVAIPLAYLYLFVNGLTSPELVRFVQLLGLHVVALALGRGYRAESAYGSVSSPDRRNQST